MSSFDKKVFEETWNKWGVMSYEDRKKALLSFNMPEAQAAMFADLSLNDIMTISRKTQELGLR